VLSYGTCLVAILSVLMLLWSVFGVYHGGLIPTFYILCVINGLLKKKYIGDHFCLVFDVLLVSLHSFDMFLDLELNMIW